MIHRENWLATQEYLTYLSEVRQLQSNTLYNQRAHLRHLLEWLDSHSLPEAPGLRPTFPRYLIEHCPVSVAYMVKICTTVRDFLTWRSPKHMTKVWIETIRPAKRAGQEEPHVRIVYTEGDIRKLLAFKPRGLDDLRDQAAVAMLFLSGMRVTAFATLRIGCVDLDNRRILQWPSLHVRTKNSKSATTYLLNIAEFLDPCIEWDNLVRGQLGEEQPWYALLNQENHLISGEPGMYRACRVREHLQRLCVLAGVHYLSPHKLRHGHAVYALKQAQTVADYKAVSQNLMHSSLQTTDQIYAVLSSNDVGERIERLGNQVRGDPEVTRLLAQLLSKLQGVS